MNQPPLPVGAGTVASSSYTYPCAAGADLHIFSEYLHSFQPGDAHAGIFVRVNGIDVAGAAGTVALQSDADTSAALSAALAGPDGDAVRAKLIDDLNWRITYNPGFRQIFYSAICCH